MGKLGFDPGQGGTENIEIARAHYCLALKINPNNIRALYGLFLCATNIAINPKSTPVKRKEANKLAKWALKELNIRYDEKMVEEKPVAALEVLMNNIHITTST
uniref:ER membrane protein complex subunit 2 n=1 Tax=Timema monikensis TaxID=170555 RepID=A0A7R9E6W2_9NEOP|nr:unnamed protein product [Timema monikensis]